MNTRHNMENEAEMQRHIRTYTSEARFQTLACLFFALTDHFCCLRAVDRISPIRISLAECASRMYEDNWDNKSILKILKNSDDPVIQWLRLALSKGSNRVSPSPLMKKKADPVSETLCFLVIQNSRRREKYFLVCVQTNAKGISVVP
jgi:hypothetical protein